MDNMLGKLGSSLECLLDDVRGGMKEETGQFGIVGRTFLDLRGLNVHFTMVGFGEWWYIRIEVGTGRERNGSKTVNLTSE